MSNPQSAFLYPGAISRDDKIFGVAGGSLNSAGFDAKSTQAGIDGERRVGKVLDDFASQNGNVFAFHSVKLPGHFGDVDHLLVVGTTLFVIDTKNWKGDAAYSVTGDQETILRDGGKFPGGSVSVNRYVGEFSEFTSEHRLTVRGLLVVANSKSKTQRNPSPYWDFVNLTALREVIYEELRSQKRGASAPAACIKLLAGRVVNPDFTGDWDQVVHAERGRGETTQYRTPARAAESASKNSAAWWAHFAVFPVWLVAAAFVFISVFSTPRTLPKIAWWGILVAGLLYGLWTRRQTAYDSRRKGGWLVLVATVALAVTAFLSLMLQDWF